ncbi:MAG: hypothetical protein J6Y57_03845 [Lachnospiraceae bacterium]|nr:hypothetical protein [Lachnospiraceae bacterium]
MNTSKNHTFAKRMLSGAIAITLGFLAVIPVLFLTAEPVAAKKEKRIIYRDNEPWIIWVEVPDGDDPSNPPIKPDYGDIDGAKAADPMAAAHSFEFNYPDFCLTASYTQNGVAVQGAAIGVQAQGGLGGLAFKEARQKANLKEAFPFNITLNKVADYTLKDGVLTIFVPEEFQKLGRSFKVLALDENGEVVPIENTSTSPFVFTAKLNVKAFAFDLVFTD